MVGELQPILNTQISPIPVIPAPDYSSAFAGFFRSIKTSQEGPSVAEMNKQAELAYGNDIKKALAIRDKNPVAAAELADRAYLDLVASGVAPNPSQNTMYTAATGKTPAAFGFEDQEAYNIDVWSKSEDAVGYMTMARKYAQLHPNLNWDEAQISAYARSIFEDHQGSSTVLQIEKQRLEMGITPDGAKVTTSLQADFNYLLGMTDSMLADGRATQEEIKQASTALSQMIVTKYAPFMDANPEVKNTVDQMTKLVTRLGDSEFDSTKALVDQVFEAAQKSKLDPLTISLLTTLLETPSGRELFLKGSGKNLPDIVADLGKVFEAMRLSKEGEKPENGGVNVGDMNLGEVTKTDDTKATTSAINFFSEIASTDITVGDTTIFTNEAVRKQFTESALAASAVVAAQTDAVLGPELLASFGNENFMKNLVNLYKVDEVSAVKVTEAYETALATQANRAMVSMGTINSHRFGSAISVTENGALDLDFAPIDEIVSQSGDEKFQSNWKSIKALILKEGFEAYLRNPEHIGRGRSRDIDALTGTNFREYLKLHDTLKELTAKRFTLDYVKSKQEEALFLYGKKSKEAMMGANTPMQDTRGLPPIPATEAEAQAIAQETRDVLSSTIPSSPLPPAETRRSLGTTSLGTTSLGTTSLGTTSLGRKTQDPQSGVNAVVEPAIQKDLESRGTEANPWQIPWSPETTEDEQMYNELPMGSWFIDPNGVVRKKFKNLPVEGQ